MASLLSVAFTLLSLASQVHAETAPIGTPVAIEGPTASTTFKFVDICAGSLSLLPNARCNGNAPAKKRTVAYYVSQHGNAVIDGDIIFGSEADLLVRAACNETETVKKRAFSESSSSGVKWPGGRIYYRWDVGLDQAHQDYFTAGAAEWTNRLPFLQFIFDPSDNSGIARTVKASNGNRSPIGCCGGDIELCPSCNPRSARHEIGHTLGLHHEHQRPDQATYVDIPCVGVTCSQVVLANLQPESGQGTNWAGSYDLNSIMHYGSGCIGTGPGSCFDVVPKAGVVFAGPAQFPSKLDVARVCELYWEDCHSICGDGIITPHVEDCDDGNNLNGDSCSAACKAETPVNTCVAPCVQQPPANVCGLRAACTPFDPFPAAPNSGKTFCMCQAGYRGSGLDLSGKDQYRITWSNGAGGQTHRVFVKPGQECGELCGDVTCAEVPLQENCR